MSVNGGLTWAWHGAWLQCNLHVLRQSCERGPWVCVAQITRLRERVEGLSAMKRKAAAALIMRRVSEAYGEMMLSEGLFQADAHPGNILVMPGARTSDAPASPP